MGIPPRGQTSDAMPRAGPVQVAGSGQFAMPERCVVGQIAVLRSHDDAQELHG